MGRAIDIESPESWETARFAPRYPVYLEVAAKARNRELVLTVRDISHTGFFAHNSLVLTAGEEIELDLPEIGPRTAKVVWADGQNIGCAFDGTISRSELSAVRLNAGRNALPGARPGIDAQDLPEDYPKWPVAARLVTIGLLAALTWVPIVALVYWLLD